MSRALVARAAVALVLALALAASRAGAQRIGETDCHVDSADSWTRVFVSDTDDMHILPSPVIVCDDGRRIRADSAVIRTPTGRSEFLGNVVFEEGVRLLRAAEADYYLEDGRLIARTDVMLEDRATWRQIRGDALARLPAVDYRPFEEVTVTGRPAVATVPRAEGSLEAPDTIRALRIVLEGEEDFSAFGEVEVERDDLFASSDSLDYSAAAGTLRLGGRARMVGETGEFQGDVITLWIVDDEVQTVLVEGNGRLLADDLDLHSEVILAAILDGQVQRLIAIRRLAGVPPTDSGAGGFGAAEAPETAPDGVPPPYLVSSDFFLTGDSLDARSPGGILQTVDAVGSAWGQTHAAGEPVPDPGDPPSVRLMREVPLTPDRLDRDWLEGDAIRIEFAESRMEAPSDSVRLVVRTLTATGRAKSLYRPPPEAGTPDLGRAHWPIQYLLGDPIVIHLLDSGGVDRIVVSGGVSGAQLEPVVPDAAPDPAAPDAVAPEPGDPLPPPSGAPR